MSRTTIKKILEGCYEGKHVTIRGWVYRKRESKRTCFLIIRDVTGIIQCTFKKDSSAWGVAEKASIESSVMLSGTVKRDKRALGGFEIVVDKLTVVGLAEKFPITEYQSKEFLRDVRHLWLRSRRMNNIMKVRSEVFRFTHEFFRRSEFVEVSPPMFISSACEGGSTLFGLKYFNNNLYLTQSAQLYLEALIYSLEKVYCVAPSFRAEKSRTIRHLTEYWHVEAEEAFTTMKDLMRLEEDLVSYVCQKVAEQCEEEFGSLNVNSEKLFEIKPPFPRITYSEAVEMLQENRSKIKWGEDFGYEDEKILAKQFDKPVFVHTYPKEIKAFYCKAHGDNPELVLSVDLLVPKIGEISTGGAREDDKNKLLARLKELGLQQEDYDWYVDLRRYGTVPHTGFGLGVERLLVWVLNLKSIMEAIPFPRTIRRYYP
jgi:asparaginyl-tRNA synthetase